MGAKMDKQCRKCGSDDLVKASLVHEAGTSGVESVTVGAGMGGGGLGVGAAKSSGVSQSLLAKRTAPPAADNNSLSGCLGVVFVLSVAALYWSWPGWVWIIGIVITVAATVPFLMQENERHQAALKKYERKWLCRRCGTISDLGR